MVIQEIRGFADWFSSYHVTTSDIASHHPPSCLIFTANKHHLSGAVSSLDMVLPDRQMYTVPCAESN